MQTTTTIVDEIINEVSQATNQETNAMNNETINTEATTNQEAITMNTIDQLTNAELAYAIEMLEAILEAEVIAAEEEAKRQTETQDKIDELEGKLEDLDASDCRPSEIERITRKEIDDADDYIRFGSFRISLSEIYDGGEHDEEIEEAALEIFFQNSDYDDQAEYITVARNLLSEKGEAEGALIELERSVNDLEDNVTHLNEVIAELRAESESESRKNRVITLTAISSAESLSISMTGSDPAWMVLRLQTAASCATGILLTHEVVEAYHLANEFKKPAIFTKNDVASNVVTFTLTLA